MQGTGRCGGGRGGRAGLVEPAVLAVLAKGEAHGYALVGAIEELTGGKVQVDTGGLYRVLRKLEDLGCVEADWQEGDSGPQRKAYRITDDGCELLDGWAQHLRERIETLGAVATALEGTDKGES